MPNYQRKVVYLSDEQYHQLVNNGSITVNGVTVTFNEYDMYVTPQKDPIVTTEALAPEYQELTFPVAAGQHCIQNGKYYVTENGIATQEEWTPAHWTEVQISEEISGIQNALDDKYEKPATGIPASDLASGVVPVLTDLIDDTAGNGVTDKVWSADKTYDEVSAASDVVAISDTQPSNPNNKIWIDTDSEGSEYSIPTYTDLQEAIGNVSIPVQDVQVNGTSILSNGVANVPLGSQNTLGTVRGNTVAGIGVNDSGQLYIVRAVDADVKSATSIYKPIVPSNQDQAVFYGLAKAAGDSTQSASSNAVGTYTNDAKTAIQSMLGIQSVQVVRLA